MQKKLPSEVKRYYKRELYQYKQNKVQLQKILTNTTKTNTRVVMFLENRIKHVETVIERLTPFEKEIFDYIFNQKYDWLYCKTIKNIDKNTYYNIMNKAIYMLAEEERRNIISIL